MKVWSFWFLKTLLCDMLSDHSCPEISEVGLVASQTVRKHGKPGWNLDSILSSGTGTGDHSSFIYIVLRHRLYKGLKSLFIRTWFQL